MPDDEKTIIVTQPEDERFALDHGSVVVYGDKEQAPLAHHVGARVVHAADPTQPLVHMVCWQQEEPCAVEVSGRVQLAGDKKSPVRVRMIHVFKGEHRQTLTVRPVEHSLKVNTALSDPIHHALQMRTPLQVRFCNPWHVASDYQVALTMGEREVMSVRVSGATVAKPQPCEEDLCPPVVKVAGHP